MFFKRISDVWDEETAEAQETYGDAAPVDFPEMHRFVMPDGCHWLDVRAKAEDVGATLSHAMRTIELSNPDTLYRVFGTADWGNREMLTDELVKDLIEELSTVPLGNNDVSTDALGKLPFGFVANRGCYPGPQRFGHLDQHAAGARRTRMDEDVVARLHLSHVLERSRRGRQHHG